MSSLSQGVGRCLASCLACCRGRRRPEPEVPVKTEQSSKQHSNRAVLEERRAEVHIAMVDLGGSGEVTDQKGIAQAAGERQIIESSMETAPTVTIENPNSVEEPEVDVPFRTHSGESTRDRTPESDIYKNSQILALQLSTASTRKWA